MTQKPILGIFREQRDIEEFVYKAEHYRQAYGEIVELLESKGVYTAILMGQGTYEGRGHFSKHWVQVKIPEGLVFEKRGPITVDLVYDKDHFVTDGQVALINDPRLDQLCWSKEKTYQVLGDFHPKTLQVNTAAELKAALASVPGDKVALKELTGSSGEGVFVGAKQGAVHAELAYPLLVQEFIETGAGVPGITNKRHDIRVVLANGEPIAATLRTPPEGGLKSNIGYGGEHRLLELSELPQSLLDICQQIDKRVKNYGNFRLYSVDFGLTPFGWRMFEANGMPGVIAKSRGPQAIPYQEKLTDFLKQATRAAKE
ncbi:MAG TPA: hypothetical protein VFT87_03145 [Candidatus Saccharimonadales bacterium]|nr:hypothetical protein [Candidatus Saccharimonadales bacterium]